MAVRGRQLPALTGLRFLLAAWVLLHHLTGRGMLLDTGVSALPHAAASIVRHGYLAVSTFFVLSGFVLARGYAVRCWTGKTLAAYGVARLARVLPVYALSLLVVGLYVLLRNLRRRGAAESPLSEEQKRAAAVLLKDGGGRQ